MKKANRFLQEMVAVDQSVMEGGTPAGIYLFKVNNKNTRTRCEI